MLLSQDRITTIFTVKFEMNNIAFTIKGICEGHFNWNMDEIAPSDYAMDAYLYIYIYIYFTDFDFMKQKSLRGSFCTQSSNISASYDIWLARYRISNVTLTV